MSGLHIKYSAKLLRAQNASEAWLCMRQLDISYDSFIRTTDAKHEVRRPLCAC